jgi:hypothetical protein
LKRAHEGLIDTHHRSRILKLAAVVGCTENGNQLPLGKELVSFFNHLMGSADQVDVVLLQEVTHDIATENETHSSLVLGPT